MLCASLLLVACEESTGPDDDDRKFSNIDVVTGLYLFDDNGNAVGRWRDPNDNRNDITAFPVPGNGIISVFGLTNISDIYLVPATCLYDSTTVDIIGQSESTGFDIEDIEEFDVAKIENTGNAELLQFNFTDQNAGFYRLFYVQDSETIYRQNIYFDPSITNFPDFAFLDDICP